MNLSSNAEENALVTVKKEKFLRDILAKFMKQVFEETQCNICMREVV